MFRQRICILRFILGNPLFHLRNFFTQACRFTFEEFRCVRSAGGSGANIFVQEERDELIGDEIGFVGVAVRIGDSERDRIVAAGAARLRRGCNQINAKALAHEINAFALRKAEGARKEIIFVSDFE